MLSGSASALISEKNLGGVYYQIYDYKPEYIKVLKQAALDLGYESLLEYLKIKSSPIHFNDLMLYPCTDEIIEAKKDHLLMLSEDFQLFLFKKNENTNELELSAFPHTKKAYEILVDFRLNVSPIQEKSPQEFKNLLIPSHTTASESEICLGLSYYSPEGEPCGELWSEIDSEYFFSNNAESKTYNHPGKKYGFYISRDDKSIKYLEREGSLSQSALSKWRFLMKEKSILYFLGLQNPLNVYGSYSRRSAFIFDSKDRLILHFRTTEIGASHILDYIRIRLDSFLKKHCYEFSELKILLADGDHNAQTYIPRERFSDEKINSYGFHFILKTVLGEQQIIKSSIIGSLEKSQLKQNITKKLKLLNLHSIISGLLRYISSPQALFERIKNNLKLLSLSEKHQTVSIDLESPAGDAFKGKSLVLLLNEKNLKGFKYSNLLSFESSLSYRVSFENLNYELRELDSRYFTFLLESKVSSADMRNIEIARNSKILCYIRFPRNFKIDFQGDENLQSWLDVRSQDKLIEEEKTLYYRYLNSNESIAFLLAKRLFGFNTNHKITSIYGYRKHPISQEMSFHHGIDFQALNKQTIFAPINLKIVHAAFDERLGNYLIAEALSKEKLFLLFAHLAEIDIDKLGKIFKEHAPLAKAGNTGLSSAPHLHLETRFAKSWDLYFEAESTDPIIVFSSIL